MNTKSPSRADVSKDVTRASRPWAMDLLRKAGVAVVTGALALSICPVSQAFAAGAAASATTSVATTGNSAPEPPDSQGGGAPGGGQGGAPSGDAPGEPPSGGVPGGGGADTMNFDYSGSYTGALTADGTEESSSSETITATDPDQNAALVQNGGTLRLDGSTLVKAGDDEDGDACNFYGVNSVLLAVGEDSTAILHGTELDATSTGSNGLFATDGATIWADGVTIATTADNSRGMDATYGGAIVATDADIATEGDHCAGLATDRGGGYISVTDSTIETEGSGSPLLYSTGDIEVSGVTGTATGSQIAGMEGLNTILINDSTLTSTNTTTTGSDPVANAVIIYQSTSGDAEATTGDTATFQVVGSTLRSDIASGAFFYLTNTEASILVQDSTFDYDSSSAVLLYAAGNDANSWGTAGSNGADVSLTARKQHLEGDMVADTISSVDLYLLDESYWTGAARIEENTSGSTSEVPVTVNLAGGSVWFVTSDSTVSVLNVAEDAKVVDEDGKTVSIVVAGETVVQGESDVTVTVEDSYSTTVDDSAAATLATDLIDRAAFDEELGVETAFAMGDKAATPAGEVTTSVDDPSQDDSLDDTEFISEHTSWWDQFVSWFLGLFGLA